tara:strand:+ start:367 stop:528 length:162 start_codon:yes stop_codon:yes gene_type:complete
MNESVEIGFPYNDVWITDPTLDETGRFTVDPYEYYGYSKELSEYHLETILDET